MTCSSIRPCPFCGSDKLQQSNQQVQCGQCGATAPAHHWNKRSIYGTGALNKGLEEVLEAKVNESLVYPQHRLELEGLSQAELPDILRRGYAEILSCIGSELFTKLPVPLLEQFLILSIVRNHNTRGVLAGVIQSFIAAYAIPQSNEAAYQLLTQLEALASAAIKGNDEVLNRMRTVAAQ